MDRVAAWNKRLRREVQLLANTALGNVVAGTIASHGVVFVRLLLFFFHDGLEKNEITEKLLDIFPP